MCILKALIFPLILIEERNTHNVHLGRNFSWLELILSLATNFKQLANFKKENKIQLTFLAQKGLKQT